MMKKIVCQNLIPLNKEQLDSLQSIFLTLSNVQLIWISGYLWGLSSNIIQNTDNKIDDFHKASKTENINSSSILKIVVISASQTGNARKIAKQLRDSCVAANLDVTLFSAGNFKYKKISTVKFLIIIVSTYGEGDPPEEAISLYKYLFSKRAPNMKETCFSVFSLGDRSYKYFAKAGKDLDNRLEELGAHRLQERVDVDLDFQDTANTWIKKIIFLFQEKLNIERINTQSSKASKIISQQNNNIYCKDIPFLAYLSTKQKITSRLALKDVHHLEIDITNSNLIYKPGDALGVWYENDSCLIHEILELLHLTGNEQVEIKEKLMPLSEALCLYYELTQNTPVIVKNIATVTQNKVLLDLLLDDNIEELNKFCLTTSIIEMIRFISIKLSPQDLLQVLCPMKPRFYSISSAQAEVGEGEVHITVGVVRYKINGRVRIGSASGYLVDRLQENDSVRVFIVSNNNFRLPKQSDTPIVMIGSGTGIAPFRAFMQQRSSDGALGKNWLFFGNLRFVDDFLYQIEWQRHMKNRLLTRINTAWSREQNYKIYVQDKLLQNGAALWSWIQEGAHVYVCGDASCMAHDVEQSLITLVSKHGGMNVEKAKEFWDDMRVQRRYQRDIY